MMSKRDEIADVIEDWTAAGSRVESLQLADRVLALLSGGAAMSRISADSLITTVKGKRDRAELLALVEARDAEIAAEAAARADALYDSAFIAGANAEFALGLENDNAGLAALIEARDGYLAAIRKLTPRMIEAMAAVLVRSGEKRSNAPVMAPVVWHAAIDAAMEE